MTVNDIAVGAASAAWAASITAPMMFPGIHVDSTFVLVLMSVVGGLIALRQRKESRR